jgi:enoyl-[acyl-carrier protein] reductase / trans-2-enoyl-CoA reductase (NAD+)
MKCVDSGADPKGIAWTPRDGILFLGFRRHRGKRKLWKKRLHQASAIASTPRILVATPRHQRGKILDAFSTCTQIVLMIIKPIIRGFICVTAHPTGCAQHVSEQIVYTRESGGLIGGAPKRVLVVGSSTGYGLASRIAAAFGGEAATIGVFFERPGEEDRSGTAGWYNNVAFEKEAKAAGLYARSINGDAFSDEIKRQVVDLIKADLGQIDCLIYSLASPRRTHPKTGAVHNSTLKSVGGPFTAKTVNTDKGAVTDITIEPATDEDIANTVAVMGGEDWQMWVDALQAAGALAEGFTTVAYSYIGPQLTWAIYRNGTIGKAKEHLEATALSMQKQLAPLNGRAFVSVNKALVTQASSAIPVVPLYISLLYKVMKEKGLHEGCIEQIVRLFRTQLYDGSHPQPDAEGRLRIDDWEMRPDVQEAVAALWSQVTTENIEQISDIAGYRAEFLKLFGFGLPGVDYEAEVDPVA